MIGIVTTHSHNCKAFQAQKHTRAPHCIAPEQLTYENEGTPRGREESPATVQGEEKERERGKKKTATRNKEQKG